MISINLDSYFSRAHAFILLAEMYLKGTIIENGGDQNTPLGIKNHENCCEALATSEDLHFYIYADTFKVNKSVQHSLV